MHLFGLEKLLLDNSVDLAFWAHAHSYERFYPIYNYEVLQLFLRKIQIIVFIAFFCSQIRGGSDPKNPYVEPRAPVHIITGSAVGERIKYKIANSFSAEFLLQGCSEAHSRWMKKQPAISAFRSNDYGYTRYVQREFFD